MNIYEYKIKPAQFKEGMTISKEMMPKHKTEIETVGKLRGQCEQGIHFGTGCYNWVSVWYTNE